MPESRTKRKKVAKNLSYPRSLSIPYYPKNYRHKSTAIKILKILSRRQMLSTEEIANELVSRHSYSHARVKMIMSYLTELDYCEQYGVVINKNHTCPFCKESKTLLVKSDILESAIQRIESDRKAISDYQNKEGFDKNLYIICDKGFVVGKLISITCKSCKNSIPISPHFNDEYKIQQDKNGNLYKYWNLSYNGILVLLAMLKPMAKLSFIAKHTDHKIIELVNVLLHSRKKEHLDILYNALQETNLIKPNLQKVADDWLNETRNKLVKIKLNPQLDSSLFEYEKKYHHDIIYPNMQRYSVNIN